MRIVDFLAISVASAFGSAMFYLSGMSIYGSLICGALVLHSGLSSLNYLNHGHFTPFKKLTWK